MCGPQSSHSRRFGIHPIPNPETHAGTGLLFLRLLSRFAEGVPVAPVCCRNRFRSRTVSTPQIRTKERPCGQRLKVCPAPAPGLGGKPACRGVTTAIRHAYINRPTGLGSGSPRSGARTKIHRQGPRPSGRPQPGTSVSGSSWHSHWAAAGFTDVSPHREPFGPGSARQVKPRRRHRRKDTTPATMTGLLGSQSAHDGKVKDAMKSEASDHGRATSGIQPRPWPQTPVPGRPPRAACAEIRTWRQTGRYKAAMTINTTG